MKWNRHCVLLHAVQAEGRNARYTTRWLAPGSLGTSTDSLIDATRSSRANQRCGHSVAQFALWTLNDNAYSSFRKVPLKIARCGKQTGHHASEHRKGPAGDARQQAQSHDFSRAQAEPLQQHERNTDPHLGAYIEALDLQPTGGKQNASDQEDGEVQHCGDHHCIESVLRLITTSRFPYVFSTMCAPANTKRKHGKNV